MNTSNAFRSHLMQQFVSQARTQSRPPLALLGLFSDENNEAQSAVAAATLPPRQPPRFSHTDTLSSINTLSSFTSNVRRRHTDSEITQSSRTGHMQLANKQLLSTVCIPEPEAAEEVAQAMDHSFHPKSDLATIFQTMLQTRRSGRLVPLKELPPLYEHEEDFWIDALDRAVQCGYQAPNHRRTEPFTFKRMIAPSRATERLAEIAYHVDLRLQLSQIEPDKKKNITPSSPEMLCTKEALQHAQRKREKWSNIPAFLVTTVSEEALCNDVDSLSDFESLPYHPPRTERALEDYASASAAVQNVLLSLHSEKIATKWVTGPVVRTPAFRNLMELEQTDRVVALIMVGDRSKIPSTTPRRRRSRRPLQGDVLVDI